VAIIFTAYGTIETAVEAIKKGAFNYIRKPFTAAGLIDAVEKALIHSAALRQSGGGREGSAGDEIVAASPVMEETLQTLRKVAGSDANVLIAGESGTGKELAARFIHLHSRRSGRRLVAVDCAAIPENLLESELFGYEKGAFTGAATGKRGLLEQADGGTLLLDEIGEMSLALQVRVLRALQERAFRRLGAEKLITVDMRILSSTNRDLDAEIRAGRFRSDLFFRLNVVHVRMPPLRERGADILLLACHFLQAHAGKLDRKAMTLGPEAVEILASYNWPGNVRELQNVIERAVVLNEGGVIGRGDLPEYVVGAVGQVATDYKSARAAWIETQGIQYFRELLARHNGNVSSAAREARISRKCFYEMMKRFELEPKRKASDT
ncbi:MAG: sigma-54-dependent Fis family transcriptional regulator, partial [Acidobacteria bacterium]|nr:sigma-54-dependent Fis family transcriptional regulator [Acidobacteriota bacterium]